jgi:hypothetical protein
MSLVRPDCDIRSQGLYARAWMISDRVPSALVRGHGCMMADGEVYASLKVASS